MNFQFEVIGKEEIIIGGVATYIFTCLMTSATESGTFQIRTTSSSNYNFLLVGQTYNSAVTQV